jgi:DNA-directed RNA polymerase specialized sigma24 family protein
VEERSQDGDFVELHGDRLLGFALLLTLGDASRAGRLTSQALGAGVKRIDQLRHPVRAAAWLRGQVTQAAGLPAWGQRRPNETERRDALRSMGVDPATYDALASLNVRSRAAVVSTAVEGFAIADVFEIVGSDERVRKARRDFLTAYLAASEARHSTPPPGELTARVRAAAGGIVAGSRE